MIETLETWRWPHDVATHTFHKELPPPRPDEAKVTKVAKQPKRPGGVAKGHGADVVGQGACAGGAGDGDLTRII